jgi:hypothetical protein
MDDSFLTAVDDKDELLQFMDQLRGQHTSQEILSLQLLNSLRAIGAPNYAYSSIMDISLVLLLHNWSPLVLPSNKGILQ